MCDIQIGMDRLHLKKKRSFRYENDEELTKMEIVLKKWSFSKTTVFKKLLVSLTIINDEPSLKIVNDDPSLTIVNEERRKDEKRPEGHRYFSLSSFKENIKKF